MLVLLLTTHCSILHPTCAMPSDPETPFQGDSADTNFVLSCLVSVLHDLLFRNMYQAPPISCHACKHPAVYLSLPSLLKEKDADALTGATPSRGATLADAIIICAKLSVIQEDPLIALDDPCVQSVLSGQAQQPVIQQLPPPINTSPMPTATPAVSKSPKPTKKPKPTTPPGSTP